MPNYRFYRRSDRGLYQSAIKSFFINISVFTRLLRQSSYSLKSSKVSFYFYVLFFSFYIVTEPSNKQVNCSDFDYDYKSDNWNSSECRWTLYRICKFYKSQNFYNSPTVLTCIFKSLACLFVCIDF